MHHSAGEDDDMSKVREDLTKIGQAFRRAMENAQPVFKVAAQQMKMAADNLRRSLEMFGAELNKSMESWADGDDDDGAKTGASK